MFVIEDGLFSIESASQGERVNEDVGKKLKVGVEADLSLID
jgi:hypothetical protein